MAGGRSKVVWTGRVISALVSLLFLMSAVMKLRGGPELAQGFAHLGLPEALALPLAIIELACLVAYVVPATSVLGAVLLAGYMGGAVCTHLRVGDPVAMPVIVGLLAWLGLYLREERLRALLPLRSR